MVSRPKLYADICNLVDYVQSCNNAGYLLDNAPDGRCNFSQLCIH